jgi:hypothetical protein
VWGDDDEAVRQSRIEAREIARKRRQKKRDEILLILACVAGAFLFLYVCLWAALG